MRTANGTNKKCILQKHTRRPSYCNINTAVDLKPFVSQDSNEKSQRSETLKVSLLKGVKVT